MSFQILFDFERALSEYTGAPHVVLTDCCTHALELAFRYDQVKSCGFTAHTYLCIPQLMRQLNICYDLVDEMWLGEYQFYGTRIWDSARLLKPGMYRKSQVQCVSFGNGKPLQLGRAGAILTDDPELYVTASRWRSDGRDLKVSPWQNQKSFGTGFHYCPTLESCEQGLKKLGSVDPEPKYHHYPDLRTLDFS